MPLQPTMNEAETLAIKQILGSIPDLDDPNFLAIKRFLLERESLTLEDSLRVKVSLELLYSRLTLSHQLKYVQGMQLLEAINKTSERILEDSLIPALA